MRAFLWLAAGALAFGVATAPAASDVPGQNDTVFTTALDRWLEDDEAAALPELAALARGGNTAAQMMLALIDKSPPLQGPWLARLPRAERVALMRAEGGMSGTSWMHAAAQREPAAGFWLQLWDVQAPASLALDFARAGEARAAREALLAVAAREGRGFAALAEDPDYPAALRLLIWQEWGPGPEAAAERAALHPGDPQRVPADGAPDPAARTDWLRTAPEAAAVAAFCTVRCPETADSCMIAAEEGLGSYRVLLAFGSPSERLIAAEVFHASPRGQAALLRRVLLNADARGRRSQIARAEARDACFAGQLDAEAQRYMIKRD